MATLNINRNTSKYIIDLTGLSALNHNTSETMKTNLATMGASLDYTAIRQAMGNGSKIYLKFNWYSASYSPHTFEILGEGIGTSYLYFPCLLPTERGYFNYTFTLITEESGPEE